MTEDQRLFHYKRPDPSVRVEVHVASADAHVANLYPQRLRRHLIGDVDVAQREDTLALKNQ